tara:strand:- start:10880 stop:12397 length:1518 start_codon:yes stop_codon:yes gene_type:complete
VSDSITGKLTASQAREIAIYPDRWAQYFRTINGQIFSLHERPYLIDIYRQFQPSMKSSRTKMILLKCSRKVEKTETICNLLMYGLLNIPYFNAVYTAPRQPQVSRFIDERFNGALMSSINGGCLMKPRIKTSVSHQTFDVGARSLNHLYAYSNWGDAHGLLGIEADMVCIDEYQDSGTDVLPMLVEMLALSEYKWVLISGTAREQGSDFWKLWEKSSKGEWDGEKWIHGDSEQDIIGYHMSQKMHPEISDEDIKLKKATYTPRRYANEVLGEFFAGSTKPLTFDEALMAVDANRNILRFVEIPEETVMGVDWGNQTTVVIMKKNGDIINALKLDSRADYENDEVEQIKNLIERYNCVQIVCDIGYGARQVKELQREYGDRVKSCYYSSRPLTPYQYKKRDNNRNLIYMVVVDRTTYIESTIEAIKNGEISLPYKTTDLEWVLHEWCSLNSSAESDEQNQRPILSQSKTKFGRDGDDHSFHALLYARLAAGFVEEGGLPIIGVFGE